MKKAILLTIIIIAVAAFIQIPFIQAQPSGSIQLWDIDDHYSLSSGENADWLYVRISHSSSGWGPFRNLTRSEGVEYVAIDKNRRGEIGFTEDGEYVARLIPVLAARKNGDWYLIPITGADTVTQYGSQWGEDGKGVYLKIGYIGSGTFTAYKYHDWGTQFSADLDINELSVKVYAETGECKVYSDITSTQYSLDDSGFGFLFVPSSIQDFRYAYYEDSSGNGHVVDLAGVEHVVGDLGLVLQFWDQAQDKIGVRWCWEDLYELGPNTHFEVVSVGLIKGILTGSYGYGPRAAGQSVIVDPTLTLTDTASGVYIANTWGSDGYNLTLPEGVGAGTDISRLYNFYTDQEMGAALFSQRFFIDSSAGAGSDLWTGGTDGNTVILENSAARIVVKHWENTHAHWSWNNTYTFWAGSPVIAVKHEFVNVSAASGDAAQITYHWLNFAADIDGQQNRSTVDDYWSAQNADGSVGVIFPEGLFNPDGFTDGGTEDEGIDDHTNRGKEYTFYSAIIIGGAKTTNELGTWIQEYDDELVDAFPSVTGISGAVYGGRENDTLSQYIIHAANNNITFTYTPVGTEANFTAFSIDNWNNSRCIIKLGGVQKTNGTDYLAYYNSSSLDLEIIWLSPLSGVQSFSITANTAPNAPTLGNPANASRVDPLEAVSFSWTFSDPDSGDTQGGYQVQIINSSDGSILGNTGWISGASSSKSIEVNSTVQAYYWRVRTWDDSNETGSWSGNRTIIVDRVELTSLTASSTNPSAGSTVTLSAVARLDYDDHALSGTLDYFTLQDSDGNIYAFTWSEGDNKYTHTYSNPGGETHNFTAFVSAHEDTYGITGGRDTSVTAQALTITWGTPESPPPGGGGGGSIPYPTTPVPTLGGENVTEAIEDILAQPRPIIITWPQNPMVLGFGAIITLFLAASIYQQAKKRSTISYRMNKNSFDLNKTAIRIDTPKLKLGNIKKDFEKRNKKTFKTK